MACLLERVSVAAGAEPDRAKRKVMAKDAAVRVRENGKLYGWTAAAELFGAKVIDKAAEWLGLERRPSGAAADDGEPEAPRPLMRTPEPAHPYPVGELGPLLSAAAMAIHDVVQAPVAICATSVLAAAALAVQGLADVVLPTGQRRPLSLYCISIAASGERKTSADHEALAPIEEREKELRADYDRT